MLRASRALSGRVFCVNRNPFRKLYPRMPAQVVNRYPRRWKSGVAERADSDADSPIFISHFGMEQIRAAHRAEAESELRALVAGTHILRCVTRHFIRWRESGEGREHTARAALAGETVANPNSARFTVNGDAELATFTA